MLGAVLLCALALQAPSGNAVLPAAAQVLAKPLSELRAKPARFVGEEVRFAFQFRGLVEDWNPFLSRFEPSRWLALEVWPDEVLTWNKTAFEAPVGRLFVRRGGGFEPLMRRAKTYQRFEARARVREVFRGEPWIELVELVPLDGEVGEGTILHVTRARELAGQGQFRLALEQYERARAGPLPPHALAALLEEIREVAEARDAAPPEAEPAKSSAEPGSPDSN
jgi:hypothetical protein